MTLQNRPPNECLLIIVTLTTYTQGLTNSTATPTERRRRTCSKEEKLIFFKETFDIPVTVWKWGKLTRLMTCSHLSLYHANHRVQRREKTIDLLNKRLGRDGTTEKPRDIKKRKKIFLKFLWLILSSKRTFSSSSVRCCKLVPLMLLFQGMSLCHSLIADWIVAVQLTHRPSSTSSSLDADFSWSPFNLRILRHLQSNTFS